MKTQLVTLLALSSLPLAVATQESGAPPAIYKASAEIMAELDRAEAASASAGGWAVTISPGVSVRRRSSAVVQYAIFHPFSTEIYQILEGSGTLVTGGRLELPLAESNNANIIRTEKGIKGGLARKVSAGDILVVQPGTPHWFSSIDGESITYLEGRIQIATHPIQYQ